MGPTRPDEKPGRLENIEFDFAALIAPSSRIAFLDRPRITLDGQREREVMAEDAIGEIGISVSLALDMKQRRCADAEAFGRPKLQGPEGAFPLSRPRPRPGWKLGPRRCRRHRCCRCRPLPLPPPPPPLPPPPLSLLRVDRPEPPEPSIPVLHELLLAEPVERRERLA